MRVVFDVTSCAKPRRGGIANYGWQLVRACSRVAPGNDYAAAVRPNRWLRRGLVADMLPGQPTRLLLDRFHRFTLGSPVDVLHGIGVRLPAAGDFPKVVMLHDLNVFEFPDLASESWRRKRRMRIRQTVERADLLLAYSEQGAEALGEHLDVPRDRVRVVPLGVDVEHFRRPAEPELQRVLGRHELRDRPYVLLVGEYSPRKNQHGLLEAFAAAELPADWALVLGGPRGDDQAALREHARRLGLADDRVRLPGWVADEDLPALLAGATFYACASLHEGFGLPVVEAQACGTPVVSSNRAALLETLGDCGLAFDPADSDAFAGALRRMAEDADLRADLARRGPARVAEHYGWDKVALQTLAVLQEAIALRRG